MEKQVAPLRQYHLAYASGQVYVWNVMLGRTVDWGVRGFGVDREEHPSAIRKRAAARTTRTSQPGGLAHDILLSGTGRPLAAQAVHDPDWEPGPLSAIGLD